MKIYCLAVKNSADVTEENTLPANRSLFGVKVVNPFVVFNHPWKKGTDTIFFFNTKHRTGL
jgi:hypothetical protein